MSKVVLIIDHDEGWTGSTVSLVYIIKTFIKKGFSVRVLTPKQGLAAGRLEEIGASLIPLQNRRFNTIELSSHFSNTRSPFTWKIIPLWLHELAKILWGIVLVSRAIRSSLPQIVYTNEHVLMQASIAARLRRIPAVIHLRSLLLEGVFGLRRYFFSRLILDFNQAIIAITKCEAEQLHPRAPEREKIKVIGEFFSLSDTETMSKNKCRETLGLPTHGKIVSMLGGIEEIKGTIVFLRAALRVASANMKVCFVLAGENHVSNVLMRAYFDDCMEIAEALRKRGALFMLGHISNPMDLIKASNIIVSPSTITHFSRPVVEAWGLGKPVVCSRTIHMHKLIDHRANGLLFDIGDHEGLAQCVNELLADSRLCRRMGVEGKKKVEREFNAELNSTAIVDLCNSLIAA